MLYTALVSSKVILEVGCMPPKPYTKRERRRIFGHWFSPYYALFSSKGIALDLILKAVSTLGE